MDLCNFTLSANIAVQKNSVPYFIFLTLDITAILSAEDTSSIPYDPYIKCYRLVGKIDIGLDAVFLLNQNFDILDNFEAYIV